MRRLKLLAFIICVIVISSGVGYYILTPREVKPPVQPPPTQTTTPEKKQSLYVSHIFNATSLMFSAVVNWTSLIAS